MTLHLIGQLMEVKPVEQENKKTGKVTYSTEIQVMFTGIDEKGYKKLTVEAINIDEEYHDILSGKIGSYVAIAYRVIHGANGTYVYPDKDMPVLELDKNPLDYSKYERKHQTVKSASKS